MIEAAARYLAGATRSKEIWDGSFQKYDEGRTLTPLDLVEMHGAALGLVWTTHTTDLLSALAVLDHVEAASSAPWTAPSPDAHAQDARAQDARAQDARAQDARAQDARAQDARAQDDSGIDRFRDQAARVLEGRGVNS
jgi:hypothetical protein